VSDVGDVKLLAYHSYLSQDDNTPSLQNAIFISSLVIRVLSDPNKVKTLFKPSNFALTTTQIFPLLEDLLLNLDMHSGGFPLLRMLQGRSIFFSSEEVFVYTSHINALCNILALTISTHFSQECVFVFMSRFSC
jgi:hypothetical protein